MWIPLILLVLAVIASIAAFCLYHIVTFRRTREAALIKAVRVGDNNGVGTALNAGADVNASTPFDKESALQIAVKQGYFDVTKTLLDKGAAMHDVHLRIAVERGHADIVQLLLDRGADPNSRSDVGIPTLYDAAKKRNIGIVQLLLNKGADVSLPFTVPFHYQSGFDRGVCPEVLRQLVKETLDSSTSHTCDICGDIDLGVARDFVVYHETTQTTYSMWGRVISSERKVIDERTCFVCQKCIDSYGRKFWMPEDVDEIASKKMRELYHTSSQGDGVRSSGTGIMPKEKWLRDVEWNRKLHGSN